MAGPQPPPRRDEPGAESERLPPGEFVSPELRSECARFLEDVKSLVDRRRNSRLSALGPLDEPDR